MGLPTELRKWLRENFGSAFSLDQPILDTNQPPPTVAIIDFMQFVKVISDKRVRTKTDMIRYFMDRIAYIALSPEYQFEKILILVDGAPIPVKRMVIHKKRYATTQILASADRHIPEAATDPIPEDWSTFSASQELLRRQLYPELFNAIMSCNYFTPRPGQSIILSGFPGRCVYTVATAGSGWEYHRDPRTGLSREVRLWHPHELPITKEAEDADPDLYNRVYILEHVQMPTPHYVRSEWTEARNDISEADIRMFWFAKWYERQHIMFYVNDGDVFAIGALYAEERVAGIDVNTRTYVWRNWHSVCMPYKLKVPENDDLTTTLLSNERPRVEYVNLNRLFVLMREYEPMRQAGVQHPVILFVMMIVLGGTDFCPKFFHGLGTINVIWKALFESLSFYSHLVQMPDRTGTPSDCQTARPIVLDEDQFRQLVYACYLIRYDRFGTDQLSYDELYERTRAAATPKTSKKNREQNVLPDTNTMRCWVRTIEWNLLYWKNAPLTGHGPNPFEMWQGLPYYPFWRDPNNPTNMQRIDVVAAKPKPVDDVFSRHMWAARTK